uniref:Uncharacterized protein n=1 Tax=Timema douglasi TaxID=61478 RepID=A0A7R8ZB01_TIMDO|nr:unnamed protein product [Timema douglasi]
MVFEKLDNQNRKSPPWNNKPQQKNIKNQNGDSPFSPASDLRRMLRQTSHPSNNSPTRELPKTSDADGDYSGPYNFRQLLRPTEHAPTESLRKRKGVAGKGGMMSPSSSPPLIPDSPSKRRAKPSDSSPLRQHFPILLTWTSCDNKLHKIRPPQGGEGERGNRPGRHEQGSTERCPSYPFVVRWVGQVVEIRTSISPSSAVELNTTSALANYATEAELKGAYWLGHGSKMGTAKEKILNCPYEVELGPFWTHCPTENTEVPGIKPGTSGSVPGTLMARRTLFYKIQTFCGQQ